MEKQNPSYQKITSGFHFLDLSTLNNTFKISWIKRFIRTPKLIWNLIQNSGFCKLGDLNFLLPCSSIIEKVSTERSNFHKQILLSWSVIYNHNLFVSQHSPTLEQQIHKADLETDMVPPPQMFHDQQGERSDSTPPTYSSAYSAPSVDSRGAPSPPLVLPPPATFLALSSTR